MKFLAAQAFLRCWSFVYEMRFQMWRECRMEENI
jgi:hypothetical protein